MISILRDRRGLALTEFAMLAPVMILLITGCIELGRIAMIQSSLEASLGRAARKALVDLRMPEATRLANLEASIRETLAAFSPEPGDIDIETTVYRDFSSSYPEAFEDQNRNGTYDGPNGSSPGEPFDDRNRNGRRDLAVPLAGSMGQEGQVVTYNVSYRIKPLFGFLPFGFENGQPKILRSSVVSRNEPIK
jgi:hypothetical protein